MRWLGPLKVPVLGGTTAPGRAAMGEDRAAEAGGVAAATAAAAAAAAWPGQPAVHPVWFGGLVFRGGKSGSGFVPAAA